MKRAFIFWERDVSELHMLKGKSGFVSKKNFNFHIEVAVILWVAKIRIDWN